MTNLGLRPDGQEIRIDGITQAYILVGCGDLGQGRPGLPGWRNVSAYILLSSCSVSEKVLIEYSHSGRSHTSQILQRVGRDAFSRSNWEPQAVQIGRLRASASTLSILPVADYTRSVGVFVRSCKSSVSECEEM